MTEREPGSWEIPSALDGQRVDRTLALLTGLTRAVTAELVAGGRVTVGRRPVRSGSRRVHRGDTLSVVGPLPRPAEDGTADLADPSVAVPVVHADEEVFVVDKPAGLVVHPGAGHRRGTMVQGLVAAYPDLAALTAAAVGDERLRPGIVHRLDRGTSGLLVVARTERARVSLVEQLSARRAERRYLALVAGTVQSDEGMVDAPLGRSAADPTKRAVRADGREARTVYAVRSRFEGPVAATLVECRLETGRTHQIRVHMAAIGHPVLGDGRYGPRRRAVPDGWPEDRPWLHAGVLGFDHPATGERLRFTSDLPDDLAALIAGFTEWP